MGFFSGKKTISVSSVVYNLAGPEADRPDYLKSLVVRNVLTGSSVSMGKAINDGLLDGPGIKLRGATRWATESGYFTSTGQTNSVIDVGNNLDTTVLQQQIPVGIGESANLQTSSIGWGTYDIWAEEYVNTNNPALLNTAWTADYNESTGQITILYEDLTTVTFTPVDFDPYAKYIYATYNLTIGEVLGAVTTGTTVDIFPSLVGWVVDGSTWTRTVVLTGTTSELQIQHRTYSPYTYRIDTQLITHGTPDVIGPVVTGTTVEVFFPSITGWSVVVATWEKLTYQGSVGNSTQSLKEIQYRDSLVGTYRIDTQTITHKSWLPLQYFFYKEGDGNAVLDSFFGSDVSGGTFYPFVPLRIDNVPLTSTAYPEVYSGGARLLNRTLNVKLDELLTKIEDNPSVGDIDYAYVNFGVSLNVQENACKKYLYTFFNMLQESQPTPDALGTWTTDMAAAIASVTAWTTWKANQVDATAQTTEPVIIPYPPLPGYSIRVSSTGRPVMNYDMLIKWVGISEEIGTGLGKPGAKFGDLWFIQDGSDSYEVVANSVVDGVMVTPPIVIQHIKLYWQDSSNTWRSLRISGLSHKNTVYGGKSVDITGWEALVDIDESGFIIPLHDVIYRQMTLADCTQMSTSCCFIVFNTYTITKQKWYQTTVFKVIIFLVQVYFYGLTQALATLVVITVVEKVAVAIFGEKLGGLIVAIVNLYMMATSMDFSAMSSIELVNHFSKAENLLALTKAVSDVVSTSVQYSIMDKMEEMQGLLSDIEGKMKAIDKLTKQNFEIGNGLIDPYAIVKAKFKLESQDKFLQRTLMTGSDIADLSMSMIDDFTKLATSTQLPS